MSDLAKRGWLLFCGATFCAITWGWCAWATHAPLESGQVNFGRAKIHSWPIFVTIPGTFDMTLTFSNHHVDANFKHVLGHSALGLPSLPVPVAWSVKNRLTGEVVWVGETLTGVSQTWRGQSVIRTLGTASLPAGRYDLNFSIVGRATGIGAPNASLEIVRGRNAATGSALPVLVLLAYISLFLFFIPLTLCLCIQYFSEFLRLNRRRGQLTGA